MGDASSNQSCVLGMLPGVARPLKAIVKAMRSVFEQELLGLTIRAVASVREVI